MKMMDAFLSNLARRSNYIVVVVVAVDWSPWMFISIFLTEIPKSVPNPSPPVSDSGHTNSGHPANNPAAPGIKTVWGLLKILNDS